MTRYQAKISSDWNECLASFCQRERVDINLRFGYSYKAAEKRSESEERSCHAA